MPLFRAKARAVDMLGKGQIADLPTAISELWKNGYDAYADSLSCDLYLRGYEGSSRAIFTLSDDGVGMSRDDLLERWIVLGTDSKVRGTSPVPEAKRLGKAVRTPMGEKGIGRLSVSYLGSPMLMLTKPVDGPCSALFMDWRILENYNLYLDEVTIPIETVPNVSAVSEVFEAVLQEFVTNTWAGEWSEHGSLARQIERELASLELPRFVIDEIVPRFAAPGAHGTVFIIFNPHEQLERLSIGDLSDVNAAESRYLRSSLSGIYNAFKAEHPFDAAFWIHDSVGNKYDLIASQNFFTREDLLGGDHWIEGEFDATGFFSGEVRVFNRRLRHTFRSIRPPGETPYGPLRIEFGTLEGAPKSSMLPRERYDELDAKLTEFGGLYIYRDGFRVLPYGRPEYDFLQFEERRSKGAGYYTFSHRRLIGYIEISRETNPGLTDKAGREGFITNRAYREFQQDLIQFFVDLSVRYFRVDSKNEEDPTIRQQQLRENTKRFEELERAEKRREKITVGQFKGDLAENRQRLGPLTQRLVLLQAQLQEWMKQSTLIYNEIESILSEVDLVRAELRALSLSKPKRLNLPARHLNAYAEYRERYQASLAVAAETTALIEEVRGRLTREDLRKEFSKRYDTYVREIPAVVRRYRKLFEESSQALAEQIGSEAITYRDQFVHGAASLIPTAGSSHAEVEASLSSIDHLAGMLRDGIETRFAAFMRHIRALTLDVDEDLLVGWYKDQYEKIDERVEAMQELAQLGMAIEIIDHQFNVLYAEMSTALRYYRNLAERQPDTARSFSQLSRAFQHLESNHQLLTPLYRTTRRVRTLISGANIEAYLREFFDKSFRAERIDFSVDEGFRKYRFETFESVIKPVFVNLVNNAIYWLTPSSDRRIRIELRDEKILVMNSGERIEPAYVESIFGLFFSRRPGGRGIGLYLAKANLRSIGFDIRASNDPYENQLGGASFVIEKFVRS